MSTRKAAEAWQRLRADGQTSGSREVPSIVTGVAADAGPVRFALGQNGEGRLLLPLSRSEKVPRIPETPTLRILDELYQFGPDFWRFLDLTCLAPELDSVFGEVADEILRRIEAGHGALVASVSTLSEFRTLLVPRSSQVDAKTIAGLVGELLLLDELLDLDAGACELWRGPLGERHDFRSGGLAVEVKTTSRTGNEIMQISSIDQLLEPAGGELCIARYTLEQSAGGAITIGSLFRRVSGKSSDPAGMRDLLARVGCSDPLLPDWNALAYDLEEIRTYRISEHFPRLIPASLVSGGLPKGVSKIEYQVELSSAREAMMSLDERKAFLGKMIACLKIA